MRPTKISIQLVKKLVKVYLELIEDVLVMTDKFILPVDFVVLDMVEYRKIPLIFGRHFLAIGRVLIDVHQGKLTLRVGSEQVIFNVFYASKLPMDKGSCFCAEHIDEWVLICLKEKQDNNVRLQRKLEEAQELEVENEEINNKGIPTQLEVLRPIKPLKTSLEVPPKLELKPLPTHLRYAFLGDSCTLSVIIYAKLTEGEEVKLLSALKKHVKVIGWSIANIRGINPSLCMHKILLEENYKLTRQPQRRLNLHMLELVKVGVIK